MKIRKATINDLDEIVKLDNFGEEILDKGSDMDRLDKEYRKKNGTVEYHKKYIVGRNKWCLVAEKNDKVIGFLTFKIKKREPYLKLKVAGYLDLIVIYKKYRHKGVSKQLFDEAYKILKSKGIGYIEASVQHENLIARNAWKKAGFKDYRIYIWKKI